MPILYPYIRVSTLEQKDNYSEGAQLQSATRFFDEHLAKDGFTFGEPAREMGVSAFKTKILCRPEFRKLTMKLQPGDGIYFAFVDRACRDLSDMVRLTEWASKKKIRLFWGNLPLMVDPILGPVILWLMAIFGWVDSMLKSQRIKEIKAYLKTIGRATGHQPKPGYRRVGTKRERRDIRDLDELVDIAWIIPRIEAGLSLRKAVVALEERYCQRMGIAFENSVFHVTHRTKNGKGRWHWNVQRLIRAYAIFMALHEAGTDSDRIRAVEATNSDDLVKRFPIRGTVADSELP